VTTWSELEEVEGVDWASLNTWDVAESADDIVAVLLWLVDDQRTTALSVTTVPELSLTSPKLARVLDLLNVWASTDRLEESDGGRGLPQGTTSDSGRGNDERDFWDLADAVAASEEESSARGCSDGRDSSKTLLAKVDLLVPLAPDLGRREHATRTTLVTERGLTGTVSTTTRDTRNTGDSTSCVV
jgi:hypothetical protein